MKEILWEKEEFNAWIASVGHESCLENDTEKVIECIGLNSSGGRPLG